MTGQERGEIAALTATFRAFQERYERDHDDAVEDRKTMLARLEAMEHLRSRIGGAVMVLGGMLFVVSAAMAIFWKWVLLKLFGVTP